MANLRDELVREGPSYEWRMLRHAVELNLLVHEGLAQDDATKHLLKKADFQNLLDARKLFDEINAHLQQLDGPVADRTKQSPSKRKRKPRE